MLFRILLERSTSAEYGAAIIRPSLTDANQVADDVVSTLDRSRRVVLPCGRRSTDSGRRRPLSDASHKEPQETNYSIGDPASSAGGKSERGCTDALVMLLVDLTPASPGAALQARSPRSHGAANEKVAGDDELWGNSDSVRRAALALSIASVLGAVYVLGRILYDAWRSSKALPIQSSSRRCSLPCSVHPADAVPLILTVAVILQGTIFAAVEGATSSGAVQDDCVTTSRVVWLGIWLVPYTLIVFSFESVLRALKPGKSSSRPKGTVRIGISTVVMMLCVTWFSLGVVQPSRRCRASVAWWALSFTPLALPILCAILVLSSVGVIVVILQLVRRPPSMEGQRLDLAQTLSYLFVSIAFPSLVLPFFVQVAHRRVSQAPPAVATITFNALGLVVNLCTIASRMIRSNHKVKPTPGRPPRPSTLRHRSNSSCSSNTKNQIIISSFPVPPSPITATTNDIPTDQATLPRISRQESINVPFPQAIVPQGLPASPRPIYAWNERARSPSSPVASSATLPASPRLEIWEDDIDDNDDDDDDNENDGNGNGGRLSRRSTDFGTGAHLSSTGHDHGTSMLLPPARAFTPSLLELGSPGRSRSASVVTSATVQIGLQLDCDGVD